MFERSGSMGSIRPWIDWRARSAPSSDAPPMPAICCLRWPARRTCCPLRRSVSWASTWTRYGARLNEPERRPPRRGSRRATLDGGSPKRSAASGVVKRDEQLVGVFARSCRSLRARRQPEPRRLGFEPGRARQWPCRNPSRGRTTRQPPANPTVFARTLRSFAPENTCSGAKVRDFRTRWHQWTRTQRIRTAAEIPMVVTIIDAGSVPAHLEIRLKAAHLRELGFSDRAIARAIGVSDKTVAKSLGRTSTRGGHDAHHAQLQGGG
jgi:hypothetical protein